MPILLNGCCSLAENSPNKWLVCDLSRVALSERLCGGCETLSEALNDQSCGEAGAGWVVSV